MNSESQRSLANQSQTLQIIYQLCIMNWELRLLTFFVPNAALIWGVVLIGVNTVDCYAAS